MDKIEIRPDPRELPKDSLEKFRQKELSTETYPTEPNRPDSVRKPGIISSPDQRYDVQATIAGRNAKIANEKLARLQQEGDASRQATGASRDALLRDENTIRISSDLANRDLQSIRSDYERYVAPTSAGEPAGKREQLQLAVLHREGDASRQATSASREALLNHENTVRISSDPVASENLKQQLNDKLAPDRSTTQRDPQASRADYERYFSPKVESDPAGRAAKREQLERHIQGSTREVTGKELGGPTVGRVIINTGPER